MKSTLQFCLLLLLLAPLATHGQYYDDGLKILRPQQSGYKVPAHFDAISMTITPNGTYANVDIEFEVSAKNSQMMNGYDSMEIEYKFSLPAGSHIHAAWLWMDNIKVQAELYEKEQAKFIYEALVNRRIDPLIVYKSINETYEARIFPVLGNIARKFKLSLLIPIKANAKGIELPLPLSMFRSDLSGNTPDIHIEVINNTFWGHPTVWDIGAAHYVSGNSTHIILPATHENITGNYSLYFNNRTLDDVFITDPETGNDGHFQLFLSPKDTMPGGHFLFAVDYINSYDITYNEIWKILKSKLQFECTERDSFNIVYTKAGNVAIAANHWLPVDSASIASIINNFPLNMQNNQRLNYEVTLKSILFNNQQANKGKILLITNESSQFYGTVECNTKVNILVDSMTAIYPVDIVHISSFQQYDFWISGNNYSYNNSYFLSNLSAVTGGIYNKRLPELINNYESSPRSLGDVISWSLNSMMPKTTFDQINYIYSGLLTNDYKLNSQVYSNQRDAYLATGKYYGGSGNIALERNYKIGSTIYSNGFDLGPYLDPSGLTRKIWAGNFITELTNLNTNGTYSSHIVNESIHYQVLSQNTAFLALEPDTISKMISNGTSGIDEKNSGAFTMTAIPNPFENIQRIRIDLTPDLYNQDWECNITDILGRVWSTQKGKTTNKGLLLISWNGNTLSNGIYILNVTIGDKKASIKVVKQE